MKGEFHFVSHFTCIKMLAAFRLEHHGSIPSYILLALDVYA